MLVAYTPLHSVEHEIKCESCPKAFGLLSVLGYRDTLDVYRRIALPAQHLRYALLAIMAST